MFKAPNAPPSEIPVGLWPQFRRQASRYGVGLVFLAAYQIGQYFFNRGLQRAVNSGAKGDYSQALDLGLWLVAIAFGAFVVRVLSRMAIFNAGRIAEYELRKALLYHLHKLGPAFYSRMRTGDIMSRVTNDLAQVRALLGFGILNLVNTVFGFISALAFMLAISVRLTAASLAILPLVMIVMRGFAKQLYDRQKDNQQGIGELSERVQSSIAGIRVVRSFALEEAEERAFAVANQSYLQKALILARLRGSLWPVIASLTALGVVIVFWYGGSLMLRGELQVGDFLAFYNALTQLSWPLISIGFMLGVIQRGRASYTRIAEIFDSKPDIVDGMLPAPRSRRPRLEVRDLSFSYRSVPILKGVSFELPAGSSLAIVGRTGSGKSTLAALLARLQPTPAGAVYLDGVDVCDLPVRAVRQIIGYTQQDSFLFSTTVGRNVGYVLENPDSLESENQIELAMGEAQIAAEVSELPDGVDTVVGERGVQLSGGQKQRVSLARALLNSPQILVLDDPLSAVDARTEHAILEAIDRQREQRSVILITHRVSAASRCDKIVVLDAGKVVEAGTHAELVKLGGIYATFAEEQRIESELSALSTLPIDAGAAAPAQSAGGLV